LQIAGIQKTSTVDFPGKLSAVLFTPGCNFNCFYCHNRQLLSDAPLLDLKEILAFIERRAGMLEGIVISGGEPTLQDDLTDFMLYIKNKGYAIKLDTNGSHPDAIAELLDKRLVDYFAVDYKVPFSRYGEICGHDSGGLEQTIKLLSGSGISWEMRTTVIPQISMDDIIEMSKAVPVLPRYILQLYIVQPGDTKYLKTLTPYSPSEIKNMAEAIRSIQPNVEVRV